MDITLDDRPFATGLDPSASLDALLDEIRPQLELPARMIVGIACDGVLIPESDLDAFLAQPMSNWTHLAVITANKRTLVSQALAAASELLHGTRTQQLEATTALAEDRQADALAALGSCIGNWGQAHRCMVQSIEVLGVDLAAIATGDEAPVAVLQDVAHNLNQIKACLEHRDFVLLNDVLQYELLPMFDRWEGLLDRLLAFCSAPALSETARGSDPRGTSAGS